MDSDHDGVGDACAPAPGSDLDGDGIRDAADNCMAVANPDQVDRDADGIGDACEPFPAADADADAVADARDNCPLDANPEQRDGDADGVGDACDRCPAVRDSRQGDGDGDGAGDACDPCPDDATCAPLEVGRFAGGGPAGAGDELLTYLLPSAAVTTLMAGERVALVVSVAPQVEPGSVRVRVGRRDVTGSLGEIRPGSTKTIDIPLGGARTVVRLRARGPRLGRRSLTDVDRLTFLTRRTPEN
jgi:hypothetical protein